MEGEEEAEERHLKLEENVSVVIMKLRVGTQDNAVNRWICPGLSIQHTSPTEVLNRRINVHKMSFVTYTFLERSK